MIQKSRIIIETEKPSFEFLINYSLAQTRAFLNILLMYFNYQGTLPKTSANKSDIYINILYCPLEKYKNDNN
jgi:hypothetical protein